MKILNIDDMLLIAENDGSPLMRSLYDAAEAIATALAEAIAVKFGIVAGAASFESDAGGLCATFEPIEAGQECPQEIDEGDEGGDWLTAEEMDASLREARVAHYGPEVTAQIEENARKAREGG